MQRRHGETAADGSPPLRHFCGIISCHKQKGQITLEITIKQLSYKFQKEVSEEVEISPGQPAGDYAGEIPKAISFVFHFFP